MAITRLVSSQRRNQFENITSQKDENRERVHPWTLLRFDGNENAQPREEVWSSIFWNSLKNKQSIPPPAPLLYSESFPSNSRPPSFSFFYKRSSRACRGFYFLIFNSFFIFTWTFL
jgi:hypothetical protein